MSDEGTPNGRRIPIFANDSDSQRLFTNSLPRLSFHKRNNKKPTNHVSEGRPTRQMETRGRFHFTVCRRFSRFCCGRYGSGNSCSFIPVTKKVTHYYKND